MGRQCSAAGSKQGTQAGRFSSKGPGTSTAGLVYRWLGCLAVSVAIACVSVWTPGLVSANESRPHALVREALHPSRVAAHLRHDHDRLVDTLSPRGQQARGLYFTGPWVRRRGVEGVIRAVKGARVDAAVIDLKDGQGRVLFDTKLPELVPQKRRLLGDAKKFFARLRAAGVYSIARIVCFSDPVLPVRYPERAVLDGRAGHEGKLWARWAGRNTWLDPYNRTNHDLVVQLAKEAQALGVDEIQFDYFRFPVDIAVDFAVFPAQVDTPRREVLLSLLRRVDEAVTIPIGVDIFGLAAFRKGDPAGLGQSVEEWASHLEVFSPMLYINAMRAWTTSSSEARAFRLVRRGVQLLRRRLGHGPVIRPFLQAFQRGSDYYTPQFIAEQVVGARQGGADGFMFWHPGSKYGLVRQAMFVPGLHVNPLPLAARRAWRHQTWLDSLSPRGREQYQSSLRRSGSTTSMERNARKLARAKAALRASPR